MIAHSFRCEATRLVKVLPNDKDQGTKLRCFSVLDFWISYRWDVPVGELGANLGKSDRVLG